MTDAFERELLAITPQLKKFAYKLSKHNENAEDLFQSTLCKALEKRHMYQEGTRLFSWCSKIMYNLFVSSYRLSSKFESSYDPEPALSAMQSTKSVDEDLIIGEFQAIIDKCNTHTKELAYYLTLEMNYNEIAEKLNIPVGTVRSRINRFRNKVKSK